MSYIKIPKLLISIDILVIVILILISKIYFGFSFINLALFFAYIVVWVYLPGRYICGKIKVDFESKITSVLLEFFIGLIFIFLQYFLFGLLNIRNGIYFISPVLFLAELYKIIKNPPKIHLQNIFTMNNSLIFTLYAIVFSISMLNLQFTYRAPEVSPIISLNQDLVWHMGNINALAQKFQPIDPRINGIIFRYHYFPDLLYAICMQITDIPADIMLISLSPYLITCCIVSSIYSFAYEFIYNKKFIVLFCYLSLFSGAASSYFLINFKYPASLFLFHIIDNTNGAAFALSTSIMFVIILKKLVLINNEDKIQYRNLMLYGILIMFLCAGMKGPFAAVLVLALVFLSVYAFIFKEKNYKKIIQFSILSILSFSIIYYLLISGPKGAAGVSFSFIDTVKRSPISKLFVSTSYVLAIPVEFIFIIAGFSLPFIISFFYFMYIVSAKERIEKNVYIKENNFIIFFLLSASIIGLGAFYFLSQPGFSQVYFLFVAVPFIQMIGFNYFFYIERHIKKCFVYIIRLFCIISISYGLFTVLIGTINEAKPLYRNLRDRNKYTNISEVKSGSSYITNNEYKAMIWIRKNTNYKSTFSTDRQTLIGDGSYNEELFLMNRFFYYSAYSQRRFFLEGYSYSSISSEEVSKKLEIVKLLYSEDYNNKCQLARENNIDYIIVSKYIHPDLIISEPGIEICFKNQDITIYKIVKD